MTRYIDLINQAKTQLNPHHPDTATQEIDILIKHCFNMNKETLLLSLQDPVKDKQKSDYFQTAIQARVEGKPLDLIIGKANFLGREYHVQPGVLIPRPETEFLALEAIKVASTFKQPFCGIELGVGTGILSLHCASTFPRSQFFGWDWSQKAIECAEKNKTQYNIENCHFFHHEFFTDKDSWQKILDTQAPKIVISNPPYIPTDDVKNLDSSVLDYEPKTALDGGETGLLIIKQMINTMAGKVDAILLEIGIHQDQEITELIKKIPNQSVYFVHDFQDIPRVAVIMPR